MEAKHFPYMCMLYIIIYLHSNNNNEDYDDDDDDNNNNNNTRMVKAFQNIKITKLAK